MPAKAVIQYAALLHEYLIGLDTRVKPEYDKVCIIVIPAEAGIYCFLQWISAFAEMTKEGAEMTE